MNANIVIKGLAVFVVAVLFVVIMKGGKTLKRGDSEAVGTVRLKRKSRKTRLQRSEVVWTIAFAIVLSVVSLAGAGLIGWYGVYLYWKFLC